MITIEYADLRLTEDEIVSGEVYKSGDLLYDVLEIGTFDVELYIKSPRAWKTLEEFHRNDKVFLYNDGILLGTYYVESIDRTGKFTFEIHANDAAALLDQSSHNGGIYTGQTVESVVANICNIPYIVKTSFREKKLYGWLPIDTRRANLAQVLFAIGATAKVDFNGVLRVEGLWDAVSTSISSDRIFVGDKVEYDSKISAVSVLEHQYIEGGDSTKLFEGTAENGDLITFTEPAYNLSASGFSIRSSGANFAIVSAGTGTLTGNKYIHATRSIKRSVTPTDVPNEIEVKDATLVSFANSAGVANRLAAYYKCFQTAESDVVLGRESPGDVAQFEHPFGGIVTGTIKSQDISLGNRPVATEKFLIGYTPPELETEYFDTSVIITEDKTFTFPVGAKNARIVLIGGGNGGEHGRGGGSGTKQTNTAGKGGAGGEGGAGGSGGKIYIIDLTDISGKSFSITIGQGATSGSAGTATTFGGYSSASGSSSDIGYTDPVGKKTYALPGADGLKGGDGADGGNSVKPSDGEDVGIYKGGKGGVARQIEVDEDRYVTAYGGGGGGAAYGNNGKDGGTGTSYYAGIVGGSTPTWYGIGGAGGNGASAIAPSDATGIGTGGNGGHGGGGGGGGGNGSPAPTAPTAYEKDPGFGGSGSAGSRGANGGVFIYYTTPEQTSTPGYIVDKNGKILLDKYGRKLVV